MCKHVLKPKEYLDRLQHVLTQQDGFSIAYTNEIAGLTDIIVKDNKGNEIFIMPKDGGIYGELSYGTIMQIRGIQAKHPRVLLVSFSKIDTVIQEALLKMGAYFLIKPTIENVIRKLGEIAGYPDSYSINIPSQPPASIIERVTSAIAAMFSKFLPSKK
jgi:hypothetical protein